MDHILDNTLEPPLIQFNGHLQTIVPSVFRKVDGINYQRERIDTPDNDFLDLDWSLRGSSKLVILSHGLEGSSDRGYIMGMVAQFDQLGWDSLAWNYRGCSGEINRQLRFYHSGATDDLDCVIQHAVSSGRYQEICLLGFSLGGNLTLKYLGEQPSLPAPLSRAIVFSVPLDLHHSCLKLMQGFSKVYSYRFLRKLKRKVRAKAELYPGIFDLKKMEGINRLIDFDDAFTGPVHGFKSAVDYYESCSAQKFMYDIEIPTLIVNARNDPFLSEQCYPQQKLKHHPYVQLLIPGLGGHVGFRTKSGHYKSEELAVQFLQQ